MPAPSFNDFFRAATATESNPAGNSPYDYQRRLAGGDAAPRLRTAAHLHPRRPRKTAVVDVISL